MCIMIGTRIAKSKLIITAAIICSLLALGGGLFTALAARSPAGPSLSAVSAQTLAAGGITLSNPTVSATVNKAAAVGVAQNQFPGAQVREAVLAQVRDDHQAPPLDRLCWIVSLVPPAGVGSVGPSGNTSSPASYLLVFIDARTGAFVFGIAGNER
jgi:hypothetical protein